jgi:hypothetical protein
LALGILVALAGAGLLVSGVGARHATRPAPALVLSRSRLALAGRTAVPEAAAPSEATISSTANGSLIDHVVTTSMVPGDVVATPQNQPVVVTVTAPAVVTLVRTSQSAACASCPPDVGTATDLGDRLVLTVTDLTNPTSPVQLYRGPVAPSAGQDTLRLPGNSPDGGWAAGESHSYGLSVAMPIELRNQFQGTSAALSLSWSSLPASVEALVIRRQSPLAFTGLEISLLVGAALLAIAAGGVLVRLSRRRAVPQEPAAGPSK